MAFWNRKKDVEEREAEVTLGEWADMFMFNGSDYTTTGTRTSYFEVEDARPDFGRCLQGMVKAVHVIWSLIRIPSSVFSEARFKFRREVEGRPGDLFGTSQLANYEEPVAGVLAGD